MVASRSKQTASFPGVSAAQRRLLEVIKHRGEATVAELAAQGLARETVRDHLKLLRARGLVERAGARRSGPGRPEILYRITHHGNQLFPQRHGQILRELVEYLEREGRDDVLEQFFDAWLHRKRDELVPRVEHLEGWEREREVAAILSKEGFLAEAAEGEPTGACLRLCHCPWRQLVEASQAPCRAEKRLVSDLLGRSLTRQAFIPDGDPVCSYSIGGAAGHQTSPLGD